MKHKDSQSVTHTHITISSSAVPRSEKAPDPGDSEDTFHCVPVDN